MDSQAKEQPPPSEEELNRWEFRSSEFGDHGEIAICRLVAEVRRQRRIIERLEKKS